MLGTKTAKWGSVGLVLGALVGCGAGTGSPGIDTDFLSDNPLGHGDGGADEGGDPGAGETGGGDGGESGDDGAREIAEADVVHVEGDRLYALSTYGGLSVIDVSQPNVALPILGRFRAHSTPFEMYVDGTQVFAMLSDWGDYVWDEESGGYSWQSTSKLVALDTGDPANIVMRGEFDLPGRIQDSRRVGDVLYLVTYEDGYCWGCKDSPNTTVTSLNVADPTHVVQVDQISFDTDVEDQWGWAGPRSVSSTNEHMYVAGVDYSDNEHSVIDVIDISDASGFMKKGAQFPVAGTIENRWQMDEYEGVLRVVSQHGWWGSGEEPVVETFTVASANDVVPLGSLTMTLPRPESLRAVRFDGLRGYVITFERVDPLFTLDLREPATPKQTGELEIPGFVYHMEPRGDRIVALGFDNTNEDGAVNVSLFDVSDMSTPTMLSRVNFGGDWAWLAEDQNRIHKAFNVLDELGLVLVPFSGFTQADEWGCASDYQSGIQLVDWAQDALELRGVAPSHGQARRALVHRDTLIGMSDMAVESFDIANRDAPTKLANAALATSVSKVAVDGDLVVRLAQDWWTRETVLEVVPAATPDSPTALGRLSMAWVAEQTPYECWYGYYADDLFVHEGFAYLVRLAWQYDELDGKEHQATKIDVVDIRDPANPTFVDSVELTDSASYNGYWYGNFYQYEERFVQVGGAIVMHRSTTEYDDAAPGDVRSSARFDVVDLSEPGNPVLGASIARPNAIAHGGLRRFGDTIATWNMQAANATGDRVRFFLERLDVSDPRAPQVATPLNVPGMLAAYDPGHARAITIDYQLEQTNLNQDDCYQQPGSAQWDYQTDTCFLSHRELKLVELHSDHATLRDTLDVEGDDAFITSLSASSERAFVHVVRGRYVWDEVAGQPLERPTGEIHIVADWSGNELDAAGMLDLGEDDSWLGSMQAHGNHLLFTSHGGLGDIDASSPDAATIELHELYGWGCYGGLEIAGNVAYCPMGEYGLQSILLDD